MIDYAHMCGGWYVVIDGQPHESGPYIFKATARIRAGIWCVLGR